MTKIHQELRDYSSLFLAHDSLWEKGIMTPFALTGFFDKDMNFIHKVRLACLGGTALEFFEFQIFIMLMPFLVAHFFAPATPHNPPWLAAYLVFGMAFLARSADARDRTHSSVGLMSPH